MNNLNIRLAEEKDFDQIFKLGKKTPEIKVSQTEEFMDKEELIWSINNPNGIFLVATTDEKIIGFIYVNHQDRERPMPNKYACLIYLVVDSNFRRLGVASGLYSACVDKLKELGLTNMFSWANTESDGAIIDFLKKQGFNEGHKYVWMDKKIK